MKHLLFITWLIWANISYCQSRPKRIITLSGALTETVDALGFGPNIVATDVTSTYPAYVKQLPKVSRNRSISIEGLLSFTPDLILAPTGHVAKEIQHQLKAAGIPLIILNQHYSSQGATEFIKAVANALGVPDKGTILAKKTEERLQQAIAQVKASKQVKKKVLFIYARGTGAMSVAGKASSIDAIIKLAGAENAIQEFADFKPYTTEAMVKANPDVILMFDFGLSSLGGKASVLKLPGIKLTKAGKNERIVDMDGQLLTNFSVRLPEAILALHKELIK
ncbi:hemin ABC transporter substrate-binding protein [Olivibacter sp. XZL3]|uniref:heme/hemin ABC transporter substrate-binding protein n=1 Tax=Olivibacter sp. XZL3 TaxID=1735116 RepID=UPI001066B943|nr:ABC transporter substrate-binding protein [Olivibacter sp. XZL3]